MQFDYARWLLSHGADPNSGHLVTETYSALAAAADHGFLDFVALLVQHGAHVSAGGALAAAAENGHVQVVEFLIEQGADIDEVGVHDFGDSRKIPREGAPLHKAAARGDVAMAKLLVNKGANINTPDRLGRTPLRRAREEKQEEAVRYLESIGAVDEAGDADQ